jgi:hypothetical protein
MEEPFAHTLSVVIPAYNEEDGIAAIVARVLGMRPALAEMGVGLELLVVDDGSRDGTCACVAGHPDCRLVRHPVNRGYGAALKTGFRAASGDWCAFLDADGTYPPESFPLLCREILNGADLVVGSRRSGAASEMPLVRRLGNGLWSGLVTLLGNQRVLDPASGMRVFRRDVLERLYPLPDGLNFTPVMSTRAIHEGVRLVEVPIPYRERLGRSKLSVVRDGLRFLRTIIWTVLGYNPARLLGGIGAASVAVGASVALVLIVLRLLGVTELGPWGVAGLYIGALAGVVGVSLFALGATFNYLVSLFHRRPIRQGLFGRPIFRTPLDRQFGWIGLLGVIGGGVLGLVSLALGLNGWPIERLWFYGVIASMGLLLGVQLIVFWVIMRVLEELNRRDLETRDDLERTP